MDEIDKSKLKNAQGNFYTQALFLELDYPKTAIFTLKEEDIKYKGKTYLSLKKRYLEEEDLMEYDFATKYLGGWQHWKRMQNNSRIMAHITEWREELELKIRSAGMKALIDTALDEESGFQAQKFLATKGWQVNGVGRPMKDNSEQEKALEKRLNEDYDADVVRLIK